MAKKLGVNTNLLASLDPRMFAMGMADEEETVDPSAELFSMAASEPGAFQNPDQAYDFIDAQTPNTAVRPTQKRNVAANDFNEYAAMIENMPYVQDQRKGIDEIQALMDAEKARPVNEESPWAKPLMMLADAQTGSNFTKNYDPGYTSKDKNATLLAYADKINARRGDLSKTVLDAASRIKMDKALRGLAGKGAGLSKGEEAVDKAFAKEYNDFYLAGGAAGVEKQLNALDDVATELDSTDSATGGFVGSIPKFARDVVAPKSAALQDTIEGVIQSSLKATLGAQFTDNEGKRVIARAYNPRLSEKENARRVRAIRTEIQGMAEAKEAASQYFETHGTLKGYKGSTRFSIAGKEYSVDPTKTGEAKTSSAPAVNPNDKVKVRNKQGVVGKIPRSQLAAALASKEYTEVK